MTQQQPIDWANKYGELRSPAERMGLDVYLYGENKRKELFTNTKSYIENRNAYIQGISAKINKEWQDLVDDAQLSAVPISERKRIADKLATMSLAKYKEISEDLYPNADMAYNTQANLNTAKNVIEQNVTKAPKASVQTAIPTVQIQQAPTGKKRGRKAKAK